MIRFAPLLLLALPLAATALQVGPDVEVMTVIGQREDLPRTVGSAHRVDEQTLDALGYDDINRVLNLVPGVYLRGEDGYGLRPNIGLRGASSDRAPSTSPWARS